MNKIRKKGGRTGSLYAPRAVMFLPLLVPVPRNKPKIFLHGGLNIVRMV